MTGRTIEAYQAVVITRLAFLAFARLAGHVHGAQRDRQPAIRNMIELERIARGEFERLAQPRRVLMAFDHAQLREALEQYHAALALETQIQWAAEALAEEQCALEDHFGIEPEKRRPTEQPASRPPSDPPRGPSDVE